MQQQPNRMVGGYKPREVESEVLQYWQDYKIWESSKRNNIQGKKFYFLQGPPYTSGKVHLGTAWNEAMKDMALRYKRMNGFNVYDRHGYDMHGLPISRRVMAKFDLKYKEDIEKFGVEKFVNECMKFALENADTMNKDFRNLGVWLDFENAYMPVKNEYIEGVWWLVKRAHEENRLYKGFRALAWCADCSTALAKHEQQYKEIRDKSIFLKFKVIGSENEHLIVWTTTPWTIAFNLAVMVNPDLEYVKAKVDNEIWIIAKGLAAPVVQTVANKTIEIIDTFKGSKLEGLKYEHPWEGEIQYAEKTKNPEKLHTVLLSAEYVHLTAGTGLVHMAPGCGPEDYEVGHRNNLPPFNEVNEKGHFMEGLGRFSGKRAKIDDNYFVEELKKDGVLIATTDVDHDYAHCERCHNPVIFRATEQWFFKTEDLKQNMIEANSNVLWVPKEGGNSFTAWLENLRDNSITKQIHWGSPVPIWVNEDNKDDYIVIGSVQDLEDLGVVVPENLHKPWIDDVVIEKEGKRYLRIPDVLDVWLDAGSASWLALDYPARKDLLTEWYPADFILEGKDQIRGWFNILMVASIIALKKPAFKAVYMHGMITDVDGVKMSKSLGNIISPDELIKKHSVDTLRYYCCTNKAGQDFNFSWDEVALKHRNLIVLWNIHKYLIDYANELNINPVELSDSLRDLFSIEEQYIVSKYHTTLATVTKAFEDYRLNEVPDLVEDLFLELSRTYIQLIREKSVSGTEKEKHTVLYTLHYVFLGIIKMFAPVCPFITEKMYANLRNHFSYEELSVHLYAWPVFDEQLQKTPLEEQMSITKNIIQATLSAREQAQIGVRWPIKTLYIDTDIADTVKKSQDLILQQVNMKEIKINENLPEVTQSLEAKAGKLGPLYGELTPHIIHHIQQEATNNVITDLKKLGKYECNIDGKKIDILPDHVVVSSSIPEPYKGASFSRGSVYISTETTTALENEGYAREIIRRVQNARKQAGLQKMDRVKVYLMVGGRLKEVLEEWARAVKEKVGATSLTIGSDKPENDYANISEERVKGQKFSVYLEKV